MKPLARLCSERLIIPHVLADAAPMKVTSEELRKRERAGWTTASQANGATRKQLRTTTQRLERTAWWPRQCRSPGYRMTDTAAPSKRFRELPGQLGGKRIGGNGRGPSNSYFEGPRSFAL